MRTRSPFLFAAALSSASCATGGPAPLSPEAPIEAPTEAPIEAPTEAPIAQSPADRSFAALRPTRLAASDATRTLDAAIASHFQRHATRRAYLMTDKPLYQPGETIWFRADLRATGTLVGAPPTGLTVQLVSPRGAIAMQKRILTAGGVAQNDFALPPDLDGGE